MLNSELLAWDDYLLWLGTPLRATDMQWCLFSGSSIYELFNNSNIYETRKFTKVIRRMKDDYFKLSETSPP
jgi:hypothetical protein